ncbi:MAG: invasion associated locus B family protein [Beijerinckiaceae bacterium]
MPHPFTASRLAALPAMLCTVLLSPAPAQAQLLSQQPLPTQLEPAQRGGKKADAAPQRFETLVVKNWRVTCNKSQGGRSAASCTAIRQVKDAATNRLILGWIIGRDGKNRLVSILQIPTGGVNFAKIGPLQAISIEKGVTVRAGNASQTMRYAACTIGICEATGTLEPRLIAALRKPGSVSVTFFTNTGRDIAFALRDDGVDKAIVAIENR